MNIFLKTHKEAKKSPPDSVEESGEHLLLSFKLTF